MPFIQQPVKPYEIKAATIQLTMPKEDEGGMTFRQDEHVVAWATEFLGHTA
jgi:hypothetical protein